MELRVSSVVAICSPVVLLAYWLTRRWSIRKFMVDNGCLEAPSISGGFLGTKLARETSQALENGEYLALSRARFQEAGNTYQGSLVGMPFTTTIEPENLKALFTRLDDFRMTGRRIDWWPMLQGGITLSDGLDWKHARALLQPSFAKTELAHFEKLESHVSELISLIPEDGAPVELQELFMIFTFHSGLDFLLGKNPNSDIERKEDEQLNVHLNKVLFEAGRRAKIGVFRLLDPIIRPKDFFAYLYSCRELQQYFDRIIAQRLREINGKSDLQNSKQDFGGNSYSGKSSYTFVNALAAVTQDPMKLRWELATALVGARDTTGALMAHIFWLLARRPEVWKKLQKEVDTLHGELPEYEQLKTLVYLRAVINESLRVYPTVGLTFRWAARDTTLPVGGGPDGRSPCFVPKGRRIVTSFNALHHRKDVWGPDADEFDPERWLYNGDRPEVDENTDPETQHLRPMPAWAYLPFGGGPRGCVGQQYAIMEAQYTTVRLLQTFRRIESRDYRPYSEEAGIPITLKNGTWVALYKE